jgi:hypothetical protein
MSNTIEIGPGPIRRESLNSRQRVVARGMLGLFNESMVNPTVSEATDAAILQQPDSFPKRARKAIKLLVLPRLFRVLINN